MKNYEEMSLEELIELYTKVGRVIDQKTANKKVELMANLERAYRELRAFAPDFRIWGEVYARCDRCGEEDYFECELVEALDKFYGVDF
jgi:hypothetical protein